MCSSQGHTEVYVDIVNVVELTNSEVQTLTFNLVSFVSA